MKKLLVRLARQLDAIDEASLMSLWSEYATIVGRFEPTKQWEEATLIFSMIQAKRWKNQLFNYYWLLQTQGSAVAADLPEVLAPDFALEAENGAAKGAPGDSACRVLPFKPLL